MFEGGRVCSFWVDKQASISARHLLELVVSKYPEALYTSLHHGCSCRFLTVTRF